MNEKTKDQASAEVEPKPTEKRDCPRSKFEPKAGGSVTLPKPKSGAGKAVTAEVRDNA